MSSKKETVELLWLRIFCDNNFKRKSSSSIVQEVLMKNSVCVQNFQRIKKEKEGRLGRLYFHTIEKKGASTIFSVPFCHTKSKAFFFIFAKKHYAFFISSRWKWHLWITWYVKIMHRWHFPLLLHTFSKVFRNAV